MPLTKTQREALKPMFGGRCAYCGCELGDKWHADHVEPVYRNFDGRLLNPHNERPDNYFPACVPCNLFKSVLFRTAERFGLIQEVQKPVVFWFEQYQQQAGAACGVKHGI